MPGHFIAAVVIGVAGALASSLAAFAGILAQANLGAAENTGLLITGGASTASATALAYVIRQVATGKLVHRDVAQAEEDNRAIAVEAQAQVNTYTAFIEKRLT